MTPRTFRGTVDASNGRVRWRDARVVVDHLKTYEEGTIISVTFKKWVPPRSLPQNSYFHGVVLPAIAEAMGMDEAECKLTLKMHFLPLWIGEGKNQIQTCRHTSDLNTAEMAKFTDDCRRLAAEMFGLNIEDPH